MKLSIGMIADEMKDLGIQCRFHHFDSSLNLIRCVFYDGELTLHNDTLYIFTENITVQMEALSLEAGTAIVCVGEYEEESFSSKAAYILIDNPNITRYMAANRIWQIFEKYQRIERSLKEVILNHDSMQKLVKLATPLFGNEITVRDKDHRYVGQSYKTIHHAVIFGYEQPDENGYSSMEEIEDLKFDKMYREEYPSNRPWKYYRDNYQFWCYDIYIQERFIYRIKIGNLNQAFHPYDEELLYYFAELVREKYLSGEPLKQEKEQSMVSLIISLIENEKYIPDNEIQWVIQKLDWKIEDTYLILCLLPGSSNGELKAYSYYCMFLYKKYPHIYSFEYQDKITMLVNLTRGYREAASDFTGKIAEFVREENFRAGISMSFTSLRELPFYYRQASVALRQGMKFEPSIWGYRFLDYRFHYLLEKVMEDFPNCSYIMPELYNLAICDRENGTEYIYTLKSYFRCNKNLAQAAKQLNIHRSTLVYRLQKISEIITADFEKEDIGFLLGIFLKFTDIYGEFF